MTHDTHDTGAITVGPVVLQLEQVHRFACIFAADALRSAGVDGKIYWAAIETKLQWLRGGVFAVGDRGLMRRSRSLRSGI